jgi:hypothetical protein
VGNKPNWGAAATTLGSGLLGLADQTRREALLKAQREQEKADLNLRFEHQMSAIREEARLRELAQEAQDQRNRPERSVPFFGGAGGSMPLGRMSDSDYRQTLQFGANQADEAKRFGLAERGVKVQEDLAASTMADREADNARMAAAAAAANDSRTAAAAARKTGFLKSYEGLAGGETPRVPGKWVDPDGTGPLPPVLQNAPQPPATEWDILNATGGLGEQLLQAVNSPEYEGVPIDIVAADVRRKINNEPVDPTLMSTLGSGFSATPATRPMTTPARGFLGIPYDKKTEAPLSAAERIANDPAFTGMLRGLATDGKFTMPQIRAGLRRFARENAWDLRAVETAFGIVSGTGGTIAPTKNAPPTPNGYAAVDSITGG